MDASSGLWERLAGDLPPGDIPFAETPEADPGPRRMAMLLAYRGTAFQGWQVQSAARTVQGELEKALSTLCAHPVRLAASGRTDSGVHAWGQVATFDTTSRLPRGEMLRALRSNLVPGDILVRQLGQVPDDFHARYSARGKTYEYYLLCGSRAGLFMLDNAWVMRSALDLEAMRAALPHLTGDIDLAAFASRGGEVEGSTVRSITTARIDGHGHGMVRVRFAGSGFLRHTVRNMVGTLVQVGRGALSPGQVAEMVAAGSRLYSGPKGPPGGLYLKAVHYTTAPPAEAWTA